MGKFCTHHKISAGCIIVIAICTLAFHVILATANTTFSEHIKPKKISAEKIEDKVEKYQNDLQKAESKDGPVEIIKQIKKVNNDGSYTVGYEAEDGTFKIESRDVLGNVKGTFGYIDLNGDIKRVSYTANNGTGLKNNSVFLEEIHNNSARSNRTLNISTTTRRPVFLTTTSAIQGTAVQPIPRRLRNLSLSLPGTNSSEKPTYKEIAVSTSSSKQARGRDPTTTVVYATSIPTTKPYIYIRPTPLPGTHLRQISEQQISRPEKNYPQISSVQDTSNPKPVIEDIDEKDDEKKIMRENLYNKQLFPNSDESQIYGFQSSITKPSHLITTNPNIPALLLQARQRAAQIQNSINSNSGNVEKYYVRSTSKNVLRGIDEPTTESTSSVPYQQEQRVLRKSELHPSHFIRTYGQRTNVPLQVHIPISHQSNENEQFLRETTMLPTKAEQIAEQKSTIARLPAHLQSYEKISPPIPIGFYYPQHEDQMTEYYPKSSRIPLSYRGLPYYDGGKFNGYQKSPLTAVDFERLLRLLVLRHQYLTRNVNSYPGYDPYNNEFQSPFTRPVSSFYNSYDKRPPYFGTSYYETENMYEAQNPIPQSTLNSMDFELLRLMPRKKHYSTKYFGRPSQGDYELAYHDSVNSDNFLPPNVREELLYRMLMLALQSDPQKAVASVKSDNQPGLYSEDSTTTKSMISSYRKPVRSVQILGEEK